MVALLAEGVDRNTTSRTVSMVWLVALLAEGVDRNLAGEYGDNTARVALLAEGVDRNYLRATWKYYMKSRPPRGGRG